MLAAGVGGQSERLAGRRRKMAVESRVTQEEIKKEPEKPIDREKVWGPEGDGGGPDGAGALKAAGFLLPGRLGGRDASGREASSGLAFFNSCPFPSSSLRQTCPLLLRVFTTNNGRHHRMDEFSRGNVPSSELQIYTWMDATLKELTSLVKEVYPEARKKGTHFNFAIVFTDLKRPGYRVKEIGSTMSGRKGTDDSMTLQSQKFQIGDYLDIAITPPNRAPPPSGRMRPY
uniref:Histone deacetylase complex subunit SAP18 n=5 Tax=Eutheria TaxID=9347 RepID=A0A9L0INN3_EQUAS